MFWHDICGLLAAPWINYIIISLATILSVAFITKCSKHFARQSAGPARVDIKTVSGTCKSPDCARCSKYKMIQRNAFGHFNAFKKTLNIADISKLSRLEDVLVLNKDQAYEVSGPQRPNILFLPFLASRPWWSNDAFEPEVKKLEESWSDIVREGLCAFQSYTDPNGGWVRNETQSGCWGAFYLFNQGVQMKENCDRCPLTVSILSCSSAFMNSCIFGNAFFSVLHNNTVIEPHYGPTNSRIRCHLGEESANICY